MKWVANLIMKWRAKALYRRVKPHMPSSGTIADVGSGTGHNAEQIRQRAVLEVNEFDVADLHWVGPGPLLMSGDSIPASDRRFELLLLLFVLQYPKSVSHLLLEARRVTLGSVIVVQSTYRGNWGEFVLRCREFAWGRAAFSLAVLLRLIPRGDCPLLPYRFFTRRELLEEFHRSGFVVRSIHESSWPGLSVSRDLFVLEADAA